MRNSDGSGSHGQMVSALLRSTRKVRLRHDSFCLFCEHPIPAGSWCLLWSGYGSHVDVSQPKLAQFAHQACWRWFAKRPLALRQFVRNTRPSREMLEAEMERLGRVDDVLSEWDLKRHESGCLLALGRKGGVPLPEDGECRPRKKILGNNETVASLVYKNAGFVLEPGNVVRHTCDVTICVEIDHLIQGTRSENATEGFTRGRHGRYRGLSKCEKARRTLADRLERLELYGNPEWFEGWDNDHRIEPK